MLDQLSDDIQEEASTEETEDLEEIVGQTVIEHVTLADLRNLITNNHDESKSAEEALREQGIYYLTGEITQKLITPIHQDIFCKHLDPDWTGDISIIVSSPGGELPAAWMLIDLFSIINMKVHTLGTGLCCSAASMIVAAGTKGLRCVTPNCEIMIHLGSGATDGEMETVLAQAEGFRLEVNRMVDFWAARSKYKTVKSVKANLLNKRDFYLTPRQALRHGIVDTVTGK